MSKQEASYRQIFKSTSLFGGVQVFNIIISIIRSKIVAVLLGPAGMGLFGLFTTTLDLISGLTNFGLGNSAVRNVAAANETNNNDKIAQIVVVVKKMVWLTGLLGALATFLLAPLLSRTTFGNSDYTTAFYWLSLTLLFNQLAIGQNVLMQGTRKLVYLAKANMLGSLLSLFISIPFYYFNNIKGIVPTMVLTSICSMIIAWFFGQKLRFTRTVVPRSEALSEGKDMLRMGLLLSISGFATIGGSYLVRIYISNTGSMSDVGFYNAGFAIIGTYVGMIFTAMGTDYYPRLSMVAKEHERAKELINHQAEIALLILAPVLCAFLIFIDWGVILLYSAKFIPVNGMIHWAALGMYFKAASWAIGFVFLAKGDRKLFFWSEIASLSYMLLFNIAGYNLWGLEGLGISFLAGYVVCYFQVFFLAKKYYQFKFENSFYKIFSIQVCLGISSFLAVRYLPSFWSYAVGIIFIGISLLFSVKEMDKRMGVLKSLKNKLNKRRAS